MKRTLFLMGLVALASTTALAKTPDVLGYEKILNDTLEKQSTSANSNNPNLNLPSFNNNTTAPMPSSITPAFEFNVVGSLDINGKKIAWFLSKEGKLIKAKKGLSIGGKEILDISDYGVTLKNGPDKLFMPILVTKIEEQNIAFTSTKEKK